MGRQQRKGRAHRRARPRDAEGEGAGDPAPGILAFAEPALDGARGATARAGTGRAAGRAARAAVDGLAELLEGAVQVLHRPADARRVAALHRRAHGRHAALGLALQLRRQAVACLAEHLLGLVDEAVGLVLDLDLLAAALVVGRVGLRLAHHLVDLVLAQAARRRDRDPLLLAG